MKFTATHRPDFSLVINTQYFRECRPLPYLMKRSTSFGSVVLTSSQASLSRGKPFSAGFVDPINSTSNASLYLPVVSLLIM
jgi:hypothetical protein